MRSVLSFVASNDRDSQRAREEERNTEREREREREREEDRNTGREREREEQDRNTERERERFGQAIYVIMVISAESRAIERGALATHEPTRAYMRLFLYQHT